MKPPASSHARSFASAARKNGRPCATCRLCMMMRHSGFTLLPEILQQILEPERNKKMNQLLSIFKQKFAASPAFLTRAPGRVNLLGEHVDYNDGAVLPAAIDREIRLAAASAPGEVVSLHAHDLEQSVTFSLDHLNEKKDLEGNDLPAWALYPAGVAWA
ncbi:MAG: galactokinase family protein, partial [Chloroflexota bacterium]